MVLSSVISRFPLSVIWIAAFLCGLFFVNAWQLELFLAAFVLLTLWACLMLSRDLGRGFTISRSPVLLFLGLLWFLMFLSLFWSDVPFVSVLGFCLSGILPLTFFTLVLKAQKDDFDLLFKALFCIAAGLAVWALIQYYALNSQFEGHAHHPLANPNSLAALFNLFLIPALGWMMTAKDKVQSNLALAFAILIFAAITATTSRGGVIFGGAALLVFLFIVRGQARKHWKCLGIFFVSAVVLYFLTGLGEVSNANLIHRMGRFVSEAETVGLGNNRNHIWGGAWGVIRDHWALGTGIGTFFLYYPTYRLESEVTGAYLAHSDPLQFWAELGALGPVLFYGLGISILIRAVSASKKMAGGSSDQVRMWSVFCALLAVIMHTHVTFNLYIVSILFVSGALLAWWFRTTGAVLDNRKLVLSFPDSLPVSYRPGFIVLPLVMLAALFSSFMLSEHFVERARKEIVRENMDGFTSFVNLADTISMRTNYHPYLLAVSLPIGALEVNGKQMSAEEQRAAFDQAWGFLNAAERLNPQAAAVPYYRGYLRKLVGSDLVPKDALSEEEYYRKALALNPMHIASRLELMDLYRKKNDMDRFKSVMEGGLQRAYRSDLALQYYIEAAQYYIYQGDLDSYKAIEKKRLALQNRLERARNQKNRPVAGKIFGDDL